MHLSYANMKKPVKRRVFKEQHRLRKCAQRTALIMIGFIGRVREEKWGRKGTENAAEL